MPGTCSRLLAKLPEIFHGREFREVIGINDIILELEIDSKDAKYDDIIEQLRKEIRKLEIADVYVVVSYLAIDEVKGKAQVEQKETSAYVFFNVMSQEFDQILHQLIELDGITSAIAVLGDHDVIAKTIISINKLPDFLDQIQRISGIKKTTTCIVADRLRRSRNGL